MIVNNHSGLNWCMVLDNRLNEMTFSENVSIGNCLWILPNTPDKLSLIIYNLQIDCCITQIHTKPTNQPRYILALLHLTKLHCKCSAFALCQFKIISRESNLKCAHFYKFPKYYYTISVIQAIQSTGNIFLRYICVGHKGNGAFVCSKLLM